MLVSGCVNHHCVLNLLQNLVDKANHNETMIEQGALKQLVVLRNKTWSDEEVVDDLAVVADALAKSVKILRSLSQCSPPLPTSPNSPCQFGRQVSCGSPGWTTGLDSCA